MRSIYRLFTCNEHCPAITGSSDPIMNYCLYVLVNGSLLCCALCCQGSDVAIRIVHKKELGCQATAPVVIKEEVRESGSTKIDKFWQLLGGKRGVKCKN